MLPAIAQLIGHAVTLIDREGFPESKIGDGNVEGGLPALNLSVAGSMAYSQLAVASNSKSLARGC